MDRYSKEVLSDGIRRDGQRQAFKGGSMKMLECQPVPVFFRRHRPMAASRLSHHSATACLLERAMRRRGARPSGCAGSACRLTAQAGMPAGGCYFFVRGACSTQVSVTGSQRCVRMNWLVSARSCSRGIVLKSRGVPFNDTHFSLGPS